MKELTEKDVLNSKDHVICGDASSTLKTLPAKHFSTVVTSPPYWGLRDYGGDPSLSIGNESEVQAYIEKLVTIFGDIKRTLRDDGVVWLVIGDTYTSGNRGYRAPDKKLSARGMSSRPKTPTGLKDKDLIGLPWKVAFALQEDGWYLRSDVVWAKPNPMPESVKDRPHRSHEFIFLLTKSPQYFFDREAFTHPEIGLPTYGKTVWNIPVGKRKSGHPAAFPLELTTPCILSSSRPGDWILDPFAGSGSVGVSSIRLGRKFLGIELVPKFSDEANKSIKKIAAQNKTLKVVK